MATIQIQTLSGGKVAIDEETASQFSSSLRGSTIAPGEDGYNKAREIWNAMIDRRPALIVQCAGAADVIRAVRFAREHNLLFTVRGAGHNIAGSSIADGTMLIDFSQMKSVRVDPVAQTARVEPGVTLGELDNETMAFKLSMPVGINSITGIAGLTLGGGFGWLSRKYGFAIDNLVAADVVTANGDLVKASADENADLFWGIRGGGGNFGIVTSFEFKLHHNEPEILSGLIVHPLKDGPEVLRFIRNYTLQAPDEVTVWTVLRKAPPLPFLSEDVHGTDVVIMAVHYYGDMAEGELALKPLREFGNPHADVIGPHPYLGWQQAFDPLLTAGVRNYWKSHDFKELPDDALDKIIEYAKTIPGEQCEIFIPRMGGAMGRVPADATAYYHRDAEFIMNVHGRWEDPADDDRVIAWCRDLFNAMTPYATGGVYVNFMPEEDGNRVEAAYGASYQRLVDLKTKYDPDNVFRYNQNIRPA